MRDGRIHLPPGTRTKRNGAAMIPPALEAELCDYLASRGSPAVDAPLFVSPEGEWPRRLHFSRLFNRALVLAAVRAAWPGPDCPEAKEADPFAVAYLIHAGRLAGFGGPRPSNAEKLARRERQARVTRAVAAKVSPAVVRWLEGRDMYSLRKTHVSWARRLVNPDSVKAQVGHVPGDVEERHYLDPHFVDARESSQAVWDVLTGARGLDGRQLAAREPEGLALVAGREHSQRVDYSLDYGQKTVRRTASDNRMATAQAIVAKGGYGSGRCWDRTSGLLLVRQAL